MNASYSTCMKIAFGFTLLSMATICLSQKDIEHNAVAMVDPTDSESRTSFMHAQLKPVRSLQLRTTHTLTNSITQGNVFIQDSLNIGLQQGAAGYRLSVDGKIMCEELKVQSSATWPDYVFDDTYPLLSLDALEAHIAQYGHLPNIPSADKIEEEGIMVGEMQRLMMEKIEELTLYILAQEKRIRDLEARIADTSSVLEKN